MLGFQKTRKQELEIMEIKKSQTFGAAEAGSRAFGPDLERLAQISDVWPTGGGFSGTGAQGRKIERSPGGSERSGESEGRSEIFRP